jgi:hypothetical protein
VTNFTNRRIANILHAQGAVRSEKAMPREGAIIFRDLVDKLEVLNIECDKCGTSPGAA